MLTGIRYTAALVGGYARGDGHSAEANLRHQTGR
jgi:hypothetical protein